MNNPGPSARIQLERAKYERIPREKLTNKVSRYIETDGAISIPLSLVVLYKQCLFWPIAGKILRHGACSTTPGLDPVAGVEVGPTLARVRTVRNCHSVDNG